ncbi:MAG: hypothetical protein IJ706_04830 [Clostridia bacterium]|nr:hypothetical protein [Clostridia bacterium]
MVIFLTCLLSVETGAVTVKADTKYTVEEVADSIVFITFKKGVTEERGNYLCASFFFPDETFEEEYEYGVATFPEKYITRYELYGDYIARKEAEGIAIQVVTGSGGRQENGRLCNYNIVHIPDKGLSMRIAYVIFVRNSKGDIAYKEPVISSFEETILENVSTDELLSMAKERQKEIEADRNFKNITDKISELVDSIWIYLVIGCLAVVVIWGAYIGIRIMVTKKNEQKADAQGMVKRLVIGIVIMFVLAGAVPLLIKGLAAWIGG